MYLSIQEIMDVIKEIEDENKQTYERTKNAHDKEFMLMSIFVTRRMKKKVIGKLAKKYGR